MVYLVPLGRFLYSAIFLMTVMGHFSAGYIGYAAQAGVPAPGLLVLFLVPVTLAMHNFWAVTDPMMRGMQMALFMKNVSMLGAALLITQVGAGPLSLDARYYSRH